MMLLVLYSLDSDFHVISKQEVETTIQAEEIIHKHISSANYSNLRQVDDEDCTLRYIADPPKGRKGRNVASLEF